MYLAQAQGWHLSEVLAMPSDEFTYWKAFYELEPFGVKRDNLHMAALASMYVNAHQRSGATPRTLRDFMFIDPATKEIQDNDEFLSLLDAKAKNGD